MRIRGTRVGLVLVSLSVACGSDDATRGDASASGTVGTVGDSTDGSGSQSSSLSSTSNGTGESGSSSADSTASGSTADGSGTVDDGTSGDGSSGDGSSGDGSTSGSGSSDGGSTSGVSGSSSSDDGGNLVCVPGSTMCVGVDQQATCLMDGSDYGPAEDCGDTEECFAGGCTELCTIVELDPSSVGCSFLTTKVDNFYGNAGAPAQNDSLTAGNISDSKVVNAQLWYVPINGAAEQMEGAAVQIQPQGTYTWQIDEPEVDSQTILRTGGVYRLETDIPVVAYRHSPIAATATNDSSVLLPEHALTSNYIIVSYPGLVGPYPSYFTAIAIADNTTVDFTVTAATAAGGGVGALAAGQAGQVNMDRWDMLSVVVSQQQGGDLSGTRVTADGPLVIVGATECANVPIAAVTYCDHLEEVVLPLEYWGDEYVGAHAPQRGNEDYHWRVYSGEDGVTVDTNPPQPGFPVMLDEGEFYQFATTQSFVITADGPFLPVQYLEGQDGGAGTGDPAMIQSVPVEQFLDSYAFVTGTGYTEHYVQVIRPLGGAEVFVDGAMVGGYYQVGNYEVSDWQINEGAHFAESASAFGIVQVGYTGVTSYGYPGGLRLEVINPQ